MAGRGSHAHFTLKTRKSLLTCSPLALHRPRRPASPLVTLGPHHLRAAGRRSARSRSSKASSTQSRRGRHRGGLYAHLQGDPLSASATSVTKSKNSSKLRKLGGAGHGWWAKPVGFPRLTPSHAAPTHAPAATLALPWVVAATWGRAPAWVSHTPGLSTSRTVCMRSAEDEAQASGGAKSTTLHRSWRQHCRTAASPARMRPRLLRLVGEMKVRFLTLC
ncbi:hypothetical protein O3P69_003687 [Scylla paramamosain]|uniref:Uncharacterized protein n=1 Tax=Scylla paramamosain TaxID=85552 RepID=A0AAW0UI75_SCYPA